MSDENTKGVSTITTPTSNETKLHGNGFFYFPQDIVFTNQLHCNDSYLYVKGDISFPKGISPEDSCVILAQGNLEVLGPLTLGSGYDSFNEDGVSTDLAIWASGDEIFWGAVH